MKPAVALLTTVAAIVGSVGGEAWAQQRPLFFKLPPSNNADLPPKEAEALARIGARRATKSVEQIKIDPTALAEASIELALPNADRIVMAGNPLRDLNRNVVTWAGTTGKFAEYSVFVNRGGLVTGTIRRGARLFKVEPISQTKHVFIEIDTQRIPADHPPFFKEIENKRKEQQSTAGDQVNSVPKGTVTIDVMVAHTPKVARQVVDVGGIVELAIKEANESYANSKIPIQLRLVGSTRMEYDETGKTFKQIVSDFSNNTKIQELRDGWGADVAVMLVDQPDYCGVAKDIDVQAEDAYAVVYYDCATGYYSFAHEIGHLQGARHDFENDSTPGYAHGYRDTKAEPPWRTIMAYQCPTVSCIRIQYWSHPSIKYQGRAMGTIGREHDARKLTETAARFANFRPSRP